MIGELTSTMGKGRTGNNGKSLQVKRPAAGGTGQSPDFKRTHSPATGTRRARSQELSGGKANPTKAVSAKLAQPTLDSFVSTAAGSAAAADGLHGDKESTNSGAAEEQAAFPALPGAGEAPPPQSQTSSSRSYPPIATLWCKQHMA